MFDAKQGMGPATPSFPNGNDGETGVDGGAGAPMEGFGETVQSLADLSMH